MASPRVIVLRAPGTNCDEETAFAFASVGAVVERIHIQRLLDRPQLLDSFQVLCIPGGFSYGDDIAAGRILADQLQRGLSAAVGDFFAQDRLILGICNGFQVLLQTGILVPQTPNRTASLAWNDGGRFEDRWVHLQVATTRSVFLRDLQQMELPIAHAEGKFLAVDDASLASWEQQGQIALRYAQSTEQGKLETRREPLSYPSNPNGAQGNVAGICDPTGRALGLMPHPERYFDPCHHPRWTRFVSPPRPSGRAVFENAVTYFA